MAGGIAKNAQEGTRSEYLAQYVLSTFGTSVPVPHPEDSGIDLFCTLGRRVGRRFLVENQYLVQVKSTRDPVTYRGEDEVKWLLSHNYPFLVCIVNKKSLQIDLYQTLALSMLRTKGAIENISLVFEASPTNEYFPGLVKNKNVILYLGEPIVSFPVASLVEEKTKSIITATIRSWIELDQENLGLRDTGFTMYRAPTSWSMNQPILPLSFVGNFKDSLINKEIQQKFDDVFLKQLSQLVNQWASTGNIANYQLLMEFIRFYTTVTPLRSCFGARILQFSINAGNKHLGLPDRIFIAEVADKG